jgi:signal transduction histidine kinase/DNA-binding NarL/FixJ family response regulator
MAKILVVEDERVAAWSIQESLEGFGHTIVANVVSGAEAIQTAGETRPDLVLMDIQLKGKIDGISAAEQIRNALQIPIIYLTAHADSRTLKRAIATSDCGYLVKPFNQTDLHTTIELALLRNQFGKRIEALEHRLQQGDRRSSVVLINPAAEEKAGWHQSENLPEPLDEYGDSVLDLVSPNAPEPKELSLLASSQLQPQPDLHCADASTIAQNGASVATLEQQIDDRTLQLQQALDFEALLKRITEKVRDSLDEAQILQTAVQELAIELNTCSCDTGIYDLKFSTSVIAYEFIKPDVPAAKGKIAYMEDTEELYMPLLGGKSIQFCWLDAKTRHLRPFEECVILACPLINDQGVIGDMWLYRRRSAEFSAAEVRLVQQVANQCAIAIRQARLYTSAQQQVTELERLNQLKDDFLNTISHELRTPISSIKMASQLLEIRLNGLGLLETDSEQTGRYLQILQSECDREISLINNMLDLSRLDAQMEPIHPTAIKLQDWIPHLLEPFAAQVQRQQQQLIIEIAANLPPVVSDLASLGRVLTELFNNACKYTSAQETIKVAASIKSRKISRFAERIGRELKPHSIVPLSSQSPAPSESSPQFFMIRVSNSGVEIPPTEQPRIFDKFYRIPNADPWKQGGTGLGLALVKRMVAHIGGEIQVASTQNWTTFTVMLPL